MKFARDEYGSHIDCKICGPSNVGNYLSTQQIPATCGFGVAYDNEHGTNEYAELSTIPEIYRVYRRAVEEWHR
jgi:succinyl-diaminopimelate desuccinylase